MGSFFLRNAALALVDLSLRPLDLSKVLTGNSFFLKITFSFKCRKIDEVEFPPTSNAENPSEKNKFYFSLTAQNDSAEEENNDNSKTNPKTHQFVSSSPIENYSTISVHL